MAGSGRKMPVWLKKPFRCSCSGPLHLRGDTPSENILARSKMRPLAVAVVIPPRHAMVSGWVMAKSAMSSRSADLFFALNVYA